MLQRYYKIFNHAINCMINFRVLCLFNIHFPLHNFFYWLAIAHQFTNKISPTETTREMLCFKNLTVFCFLFVQPYNKQKTENSKVFELPFFSEKILLYILYTYNIYNNIILEKTYPFKNQTVFCFLFVSFVNKTVFSWIRLTLSELGLT